MLGDVAASPPNQFDARAGRPVEKDDVLAVGLKLVPLPVRITGEAISILAMALATLALGTALYLHIGFAPWAAILTALAAYVCMLAVHAMMPRHLLNQYDEDGFDGPAFAPVGFSAGGVKAAPLPPRAKLTPATKLAAGPRLAAEQKRVPEAKSAPVSLRTTDIKLAPQLKQTLEAAFASAPTLPAAPAIAPAAKPAPMVSFAPAVKPDQQTKPEAVKPASAPPSLQHSPARPVMPAAATKPAAGGIESAKQALVPPRLPEAPPAAAAPPTLPPRPVAPSPREADVEMIQGLIKKLAEEVNAASTAPPKSEEAASKISERAITKSVDALKTTADSMRSMEQGEAQRPASAPQKAPVAGATESGRPAAVNARLSALAEALAVGRVEVLLDPIVDFSAQRPRHFEVQIRLRDEAGKVLDTEESKVELAGTGMLPRLDGARLGSASQIAMRFSGRMGVLFSTISGEALGGNRFFDDVAQAYRERQNLAGQLIMTFSQSDVRGFGAREWRSLADFDSLGFRFAIAGVTDLDMDFELLKARGFEFVKLDADVFLKGLPAGNDMFIPAADICKHVARLGLSVIVGRMADEHAAAKIFGFGVLYGQGTLFGSAKAVKREVLSGKGHAAA